jgi:hypothetical protein
MKKILFLQFAASATLITVFNGCSGGNNTVPPFAEAGSVGGFSSAVVCGGLSGVNAETCAQNFESTSDKAGEFNKSCLGSNRNAQKQQLCHVSVKDTEYFSIATPENAGAVNDNALPILNPNSQNGGLPTGITVFPGDLLTIKMADGHYSSKHPSDDQCSNEVNVDGNQKIEGKDVLVNNQENGMQAGAYLEFVDAAGVRSGFQAVGTTSVRIKVPTTGSQSDPLTVLVGYNASALSCGDIQISYQVRRCIDSSLNTYDCSKL